jgi:hypothetical protein
VPSKAFSGLYVRRRTQKAYADAWPPFGVAPDFHRTKLLQPRIVFKEPALWLSPPLAGFTTILLLPAALPPG